MEKSNNLSNHYKLLRSDKLEKIAAILLYIWVASPIIAMLANLLSIFLVRLECPIFMQGQTVWYVVLLQVGLLGCLIGLTVFIKSVVRAKRESISLKEYVINNIIPILLFFMLLWSLLSTIFSDNISLSFFGTFYRKDGMLTYFAYCGIFCCGYAIKSKIIARRLIMFFITIASFLSILVLLDIPIINIIFGLSVNASIFLNTNHFGYYICLAIMSSAMLFISEDKYKAKQILWIILFAAMTASLVKNNSFGPYIGVVVGLISFIILIIWIKKHYIRKVLLLVFVFISMSIIMSTIGHSIFNEFGKLSSDICNIVHKSEDAVKAGSHRWELWQNGFRFIGEKPLFGYGPENLGAQYIAVLIKYSDRPHNELIQFAASLGILAAVLYILSIIVHYLRLIIDRKRISLYILSISCVMAAYLVSSMFGNTMYYTTPYFFMIFGLANLRRHKDIC